MVGNSAVAATGSTCAVKKRVTEGSSISIREDKGRPWSDAGLVRAGGMRQSVKAGLFARHMTSVFDINAPEQR